MSNIYHRFTLCVALLLCLLCLTAAYASLSVHRHSADHTPGCGHEQIAADVADEPMTYVSFGKKKKSSLQLDSLPPSLPARSGATTPSQPRIIEVQAADSTSTTWAPIRIAVFTPDLDDDSRYCTAVGQSRPDYYGNTINCDSTADILTEAKKRTLINFVLPEAVKAHTSRLMVQPLADDTTIKVGVNNNRYCKSFTIPQSHTTDGVADADFIVYVAAGPTSTPTSFIAWALTCQWFPGPNYHAAVGIIYFNPRYLPESVDETTSEIDAYGGDPFGSANGLRRTAIHELLHALGFTYNVFNGLGMMQYVPSLRGKSNVPVLNGTAVRAAAKAHYGLTNSDLFYGLELEDEGASGTTLSHWKRRSTKDELMAAVLNLARYSSLSLAVMEDIGYYKAVYDQAEPLPYGYQSGIAMFDKPCVSAPVSNVPSVFCATTSASVLSCTADRLKVGRCYLTSYSAALPSYEQYFSQQPAYGGALPYMDYCPVIQGLSNAACNSGSLHAIPGSVISDSSRCFDATDLVVKTSYSGVRAICAQVHCNSATSTYEVLVYGASTWLSCGAGGDGVSVTPASTSSSVYADGGTIACPRYADVCYANPTAFAEPTVTTIPTTTTTPKPSAALCVSPRLWSIAGPLLPLLLLCM